MIESGWLSQGKPVLFFSRFGKDAKHDAFHPSQAAGFNQCGPFCFQDVYMFFLNAFYVAMGTRSHRRTIVSSIYCNQVL